MKPRLASSKSSGSARLEFLGDQFVGFLRGCFGVAGRAADTGVLPQPPGASRGDQQRAAKGLVHGSLCRWNGWFIRIRLQTLTSLLRLAVLQHFLRLRALFYA